MFNDTTGYNHQNSGCEKFHVINDPASSTGNLQGGEICGVEGFKRHLEILMDNNDNKTQSASE